MAIVNISPVTWKCLAPNNIYKLKKEEEINKLHSEIQESLRTLLSSEFSEIRDDV